MDVAMQINEKINIDEINIFLEEILFKALSEKKIKIIEEVKEIMEEIIRQLNKSVQHLSSVHDNYCEPDGFRKKVYAEIKKVMPKVYAINRSYAYIFYYVDEDRDRPLYVGISESTAKEIGKRLKDHFRGYSKFYNSIPKRFLSRIDIYTSAKITSDNLKQFELYLIKELNPLFNDSTTIELAKNEAFSKNEIILFKKVSGKKIGEILIN